MIWFKCNKCQKTHNRPDTSAGTMIFCECGNGTTVPWESTAPEAAAPPVPMATPKGPVLEPIQFDPVTIPTPPSSSGGSRPSSYPSKPSRYDDEEDDRPYRRGRTEKRDPDFCFNHQRRPKVETCTECEQSFCADCLVKSQGKLLCGPCKNFKARTVELPPGSSTMANASLIIALIAGPICVCLLTMSPNSTPMRVMTALFLVPQLLAIGLGLWALRDAERDRKGGGQWVAVTGVIAAAMTCVMVLLLNLAASRLA